MRCVFLVEIFRNERWILLFVCKSKRLANFLIENGNSVIRIDTDQKSKGFLVFLFDKNELLNKNLEKWDEVKNTYLIS